MSVLVCACAYVCVCDVRAYACVCMNCMHALLSVQTNNIYALYSCCYPRLSKPYPLVLPPFFYLCVRFTVRTALQHASITLTRHTLVVAGWNYGTALCGLRGACRRGGGAVEGGLQHRHSGGGIGPHTHTSHTHTHTPMRHPCAPSLVKN